jgi:hypothetical protein
MPNLNVNKVFSEDEDIFEKDLKRFLQIAEELDKDAMFQCRNLIWKMSPEQRKSLFYGETFRATRKEYAEFMLLYAEDDVEDIRELIEDSPTASENYGVQAGLDLISIKENQNV